jgi:antitoxin (DNA-binding transcriptional repressor) of toxin-antitoxin stability system
MQTTVSTSEAAANLSTVIEQAKSSPVVIRDGDENVAMIFSLNPRRKTDEERQAAWQRFEETRNLVAAELEASLAKDGISVDDFLADALKG